MAAQQYYGMTKGQIIRFSIGAILTYALTIYLTNSHLASLFCGALAFGMFYYTRTDKERDYKEYSEGLEKYQKFQESVKRRKTAYYDPDPAPAEHDGWGIYVLSYNDKLYGENTARPTEIAKALKGNYPLDVGSDEYYQKLFPNVYNSDPDELQKRIDKYRLVNKIEHFDGHLAIGGNLFWDGQGHLITVGSNRSGKGSALVIPALLGFPLRYPKAPSFIVLDPKGENLAITGKYLKLCGYNVICINPFGIPEIHEFGNNGFNVFDTFSASDPDFDSFSSMIANAIAPNTKNSNEHFRSTSRTVINLYIRHMMTQDVEPRNFRTLYKWLRLGGDERKEHLSKMALNTAFDGDITDEALALINQMGKGGEEQESTYSTIRTLTDLFKNQQLRESISRSDFDITKIAHEKTALFICINPAEMHDNQAWLRILFGSFMRSLTKNYSKERKLVMPMDEFIQMGYQKEFEIFSNYASGLGAGITLWPIIQSLGDLKGLYPDSWERFVNNAIIKHFIKVGDNFTAEYVSKRMPIVEKGDKNRPNKEPLYRMDQVQNETDIITFITNLNKPAIFKNKPYWEIETISKTASPNPFR